MYKEELINDLNQIKKLSKLFSYDSNSKYKSSIKNINKLIKKIEKGKYDNELEKKE
jgi:hypothetical protein